MLLDRVGDVHRPASCVIRKADGRRAAIGRGAVLGE